MSIKKYVVSRDDSIYHAWPDIVKTKEGKLICVFTECMHHLDRDESRIVYCESFDKGATWSAKRALSEKGSKTLYFNCARITRLPDDSLIVLADKISKHENEKSNIYYWKADSEGKNFEGPYLTPATGIVPDKLLVLESGRWIIAAHFMDKDINKLVQYLWYSDNEGSSWSERIIVAKDERYNLCEASILEVEKNTLVAFMRENSLEGTDCLKAISYDSGETWEGIYHSPIPGCHRPVSGFLQDNSILITYRFLQGGKSGWGNMMQNFMGCFQSKESALEKDRKKQHTRIFPIDYDRSPVADLGYSGWVQFEDGTIYVVYYIVDDAPKGQIRACSFKKEDFLIL